MNETYIRKHIWDSPRHNKSFFSKIEEKMAYLLRPQSVKDMLFIIDEIAKLGVPTRGSKQSLVENVAIGYMRNNIQVFSMNSSSLTRNPNVLREKPQYKKITYLNDEIKKISEQIGIKFTYTNILPDYNPQFPLEIFESAWENNKKQLERDSGMEAQRLSQMAPGRFEEIQANIGTYMDVTLLNNKIDEHAKSSSNIINFVAPKDFSRQQIIHYSTIGIILEEILPNGILLDVQKRYYPFEQPFYNFARKDKLPIILCGQEIPDGKVKKKFNLFQTIRDR